MADRRRRRRVSSQGETEESEDESVPTTKPPTRKVRDSECESEQGGADDSEEFESADDGNEDDDDDEETETEDDEDATTVDESVDLDDSWIEERQSGDGQEQPDEGGEKALDDDEDQKNPAYIPRKGAFYEHDTRIDENEEDKRPKKKLWQDEGKWDHDRFRQELQAPKSREEIIAQYGYDIRAYDKPPDAPKRSNKPRRDRQPRLQDFIKDDDRPKYDNYSKSRYVPREGPQDIMKEEWDNQDSYQNNQEANSPPDSYGGFSRGGPRGRGRGSIRGFPRRGRGGRGTGPRSYSDMRENRYQDRNREGFQDDRSIYQNQDSADFYPPNQSSGQGRQFEMNRFNQRGSNRFGNRFDNSYDNRYHQNRYDNRYDNRSKSISPDKLPSYEHTSSSSHRKDIIMEPSNEAPAGFGSVDDGQEYGTGSSNFGASERKSYSHERRGKAGKMRAGHEAGHFMKPIEQGMQQMKIKEEQPKEDVPPPVPPPQPSGPPAGRTTITTNASQIIIPTTALVTARPIQTTDIKSTSNTLRTQPSKPDTQSRPKRYSSQRQRNVPETSYQESPPENNQVSQTQGQKRPPSTALVGSGSSGHNQRGPPLTQSGPPRSTGGGPSPVSASTPPFYPAPRQAVYPATGARPVFRPGTDQSVPLSSFPQTPLVQQPVTYTIPVTSQMQSPPRMFNPATAATIATLPTQQPPVMQTAYMPAPLVNYAAPPPGPPTHYQIAGHVPLQTYAPSQVPPPPVPAVPPPVAPVPQVPQVQQVQQVPPVQSQQHEAIHVKGGTTYFNPVLQHPSPSRSPIRRIKAAIPIVNPQDITHPNQGYIEDFGPEDEYEDEADNMGQFESSSDSKPQMFPEVVVSEQALSAEAKEFTLETTAYKAQEGTENIVVDEATDETNNTSPEHRTVDSTPSQQVAECIESPPSIVDETPLPLEVEREQSDIVKPKEPESSTSDEVHKDEED